PAANGLHIVISLIREAAVMVPQSRPSRSAPPASRRRPARSVRLRCEAFEDRITPTNLFTVHAPYTFSGLNNNGCVAVADFDHNGFMDAVLSNYGPSESSGTGNKISILYGNASGFTPVQPTTGGTNVSFVTVADINGDGRCDGVATNGNRSG